MKTGTGGVLRATGERSKGFARRFFAAEGCKLRVGAYTSLNTLCTYLESDVSAEGQAERNFWVSASSPASAETSSGVLSIGSGHGGIIPYFRGGHGLSVSSQKGCQHSALCTALLSWPGLCFKCQAPLLQCVMSCVYHR